jgi:hypothetical protein
VVSELTQLEQDRVFGARVRVGPVPETLAAPVVDLPWLQATAREAVVRIHEVARFHISDGRQVLIEPACDTFADSLDGWLNGTVAALVLAQRGQFALHASTVRLDGRLVAVAGRSGAGKSTTVCVLAQRGHPVVTDDVTAIEPPRTGDGRSATVRRSARRLHLWPVTADRLGIDQTTGRPVSATADKRAYPIAATTGSYALGLIVILNPSPHVAEPAVRRLDGVAAAQALVAHTYRSHVRRLYPGPHLRWVAAVAAAVPVVQIDRPVDGWTGDEVAALVERAAAEMARPATR